MYKNVASSEVRMSYHRLFSIKDRNKAILFTKLNRLLSQIRLTLCASSYCDALTPKKLSGVWFDEIMPTSHPSLGEEQRAVD